MDSVVENIPGDAAVVVVEHTPDSAPIERVICRDVNPASRCVCFRKRMTPRTPLLSV